MKLSFNNQQIYEKPIVQDPIGRYYLNPDGKTYYEPTIDNWMARPLPAGVEEYQNGSHATPNYFNGMLQLAWDIYAPSYSMLYSDHRMKCIVRKDLGAQSYSAFQDMDVFDNTEDTLILLVVHTENFTKLWEIPNPIDPIIKNEGTMGHFHMAMFKNGQPVNFWDYIDRVTPTPTCEEKIAELESEIRVLENNNAVLMTQCETLGAENEALKEENKRLDKMVGEMENRIEELEKENEGLERTIEKLEKQLEQCEKPCKWLCKLLGCCRG